MKSIVLTIAGLCLALLLNATHNRGGEIIFQQTGPLTVRAEAHLYQKAVNMPANRDTLVICWGDGNCNKVTRINGPDVDGDGLPDGEPIPGTDAKLSIYGWEHAYDAPGTYTISLTDPNRNGGILNVNFPNSEQVRFHVQSQVTVTNDNTPNHSPILYEPLVIDRAAVSYTYRHTPNAFDPDGDSIAYRLITPYQDVNLLVPNYEDSFYNISIDPVTGVLQFETPHAGEYVFAIEVSTYRDGALQDIVIRDMSVFCGGEAPAPPLLSLSDPTPVQEVLVGDTITIDAAALSQPFGSPVHLTCTGGLFEYFGTPATFDSLNPAVQPIGTFQWVVEPEDQREAPYQIVFKARDDSNPIGLSSLTPLRFRVVDQLTSTAPLPGREALKLFPNPATASIQIEWPAGFQPTAFRIHNAAGQIVQSGAPPARQPRLSIPSLPSGWYVLALTNAAGKVLQQPFIKQ